MGRAFIGKIKYHKLVLFTLLVAMVSALGMNTIYAKDGNTDVSFAKSESDAFPLSVTVTGSGQLNVGDIMVRETSKVFDLKVDESMVFNIKADKGGRVEEVKLNGEDITAQIKNNQIIVPGAKKSQKLEVRFMKIKNQNISTGVIVKTGGYIGIIALSSGILLYLISKKRKDNQSDNERESEKNGERG